MKTPTTSPGSKPRRHCGAIFAGLALLAAIGVAAPSVALAQPDRPIHVLVGFPPGGATDAIARVVFDRLPAVLGQPVVVENKPGAGGRIAADAVLASNADGLTYMVAPNATPTFQTLVFGDQIRWNVLKDFAPVAAIASYPLGMGVALNTGATTAREFVDWVRRNPGKASFGTPGLGGQNHFLGVQLAAVAGVDLPVTPYKGSPPMVTDLIGGHVPAAISLMDGMMAQQRAGKIRVIGIFTKERSPLMPEVPTFAEQGFDVTSGEGWTGVWTKAGTPAKEIERMQRAIETVLQMPEVRKTLAERLWVHPNFRTAAQTDALLRAELEHWAPIIKRSGFTPQK
ncbi:MAG: Bug family tripartite tricarboxylate transporter substrate binding protein [Lautropia sp.]